MYFTPPPALLPEPSSQNPLPRTLLRSLRLPLDLPPLLESSSQRFHPLAGIVWEAGTHVKSVIVSAMQL